MSLVSSSRNISKRSLTFNKSFIISILIHIILIFSISITTYYKLPIFSDSPIINVKFANSSQDNFTNINFGDTENLNKDISFSSEGKMNSSKNITQSFKIKKLQANSIVNSDEAMYLNFWQRQIEKTGDNLISNSKKIFNGKVQIMATVDVNGNLIDATILISSGDKQIDEMAINILKKSAPFAAFNQTMSDEYSVLEIVRDWNFSSN
ncbi:MAG: energy transducer TonB [Gammaproteobacteria bacterium]|jgi:TonB family protein|tara:strand:+ start:9065 stop:9688 length:624 start_codon:yes stop_codon:yes gene_type:complete